MNTDALLTLTRVRELGLSVAPDAGRPAYLSAASGLVFADRFFYVIADDELQLGEFGSTDNRPGALVRLIDGELPDGKKKRKAAKPDFETLMRLSPFEDHPGGALLALGSGSKPNRRLGALLALDITGKANGRARVIDLMPLFSLLDDQIAEVNIEGGIVNGDELQLLQRGNKGEGQNALITLPLVTLCDLLRPGGGDIRTDTPADASQVRTIVRTTVRTTVRNIDLGDIDGTPLCFTDGALLPNGDIVFSAVAENTKDSYNDGQCAGAAVGIMDREGKLRRLHRLDACHKIEGIDAHVADNVIHLWLVTDADDIAVPAALFTAKLALG